ncbi:MAG: hypothetical protein ACE5IZ_04750 [Dehalococcoidia bacterium]
MKGVLTKGWVMLMAAIIGVGLVGATFTLWTKQNQIEGVVSLNTLDVAKIKAFTNDDNKVDDGALDTDDFGECTNPDGTVQFTSCDPSGPANEPGAPTSPRYEKDIATCTAAIDQASTDEKIDFHIVSGYPSYWCTVWFKDHNVGTVPVKLQRAKLAGSPIKVSCTYDIDPDQDGDVDANVHVVYPEPGCQLDPSDELWGRIDTHLKNGAPPGLAFSFLVELIWTQWNEFDPNAIGPAECPPAGTIWPPNNAAP